MKRWLSIAGLIGIAALIGFSSLAFTRYQALFSPILKQSLDGPVLIEIPKGANLSEISSILKQHLPHLDVRTFTLLVRWQGLGTRLQAGEYAVYPNITTALGLLDNLVTGKVFQRPFTLVSGWTLQQVLIALSQEKTLEPLPDDWQASIHQHPVIHEKRLQLGIKTLSSEGLFFPETYYFSKPSTALQLLIRAENQALDHLKQVWEARSDACPLKTPYEALILASILEKETGILEEYPLMAGVYCNRLQQKMPLQADPTVSYGLGLGNQALRLSDLKKPSPYNTYLQTGLPPTPIAIPSVPALLAVLHPQKTQALYFVAIGDGSGRHIFSETLQQHQVAVKAYRQRKQTQP